MPTTINPQLNNKNNIRIIAKGLQKLCQRIDGNMLQNGK
jgi:hypothetical protein